MPLLPVRAGDTPGAVARGGRPRLRPRRPARRRRGGGDGNNRAHALDAGLSVERRGGRERYREGYFDVYPGVWRHGDWIVINETAALRHLRALRLDHKPRGRQDGDERDLLRRRRRSRRSPTASSWTSRGPAATPTCPSSWCSRGRRARRRPQKKINKSIRERTSRATSRNGIFAVPEVPKTLTARSSRSRSRRSSRELRRTRPPAATP